MANFHREPDCRQRFLLPVDMADWVPDTDLVHLLLDAVIPPSLQNPKFLMCDDAEVV